MEDNVVCKAKFKSIGLGLIIVYVIVFCLASFFTFDTKHHTEYEVDQVATQRNWMRGKNGGELVYRKDKPALYEEENYLLWWKEIATKTYNVREDTHKTEEMSWKTDYIMILVGVLILPPLLIILLLSNKSKNSKLELTDKEISGIHKKIFSTEKINLPIDKVDSAMVKKNLYNALTGGKTVVICANSGNYKFPWVRNAEEFVEATQNKIVEHKKTVEKEKETLISSVTNNGKDPNTADKIKELKSLLDDGIISQEDFDQKKSELLAKM